MTASVLDRVPLEHISARAKAIRPGRTLLLAVAGLLFLAGYLFARTFVVAFRIGAWIYAATRVGFEAAHGPTRQQQIDALQKHVNDLSLENKRLS